MENFDFLSYEMLFIRPKRLHYGKNISFNLSRRLLIAFWFLLFTSFFFYLVLFYDVNITVCFKVRLFFIPIIRQ